MSDLILRKKYCLSNKLIKYIQKEILAFCI